MLPAMTFGTLAIVNAPTLADGLVELLRIGDALQLAGQDCGVQLYRWPDGRLSDVEPDYELPPGVLGTADRLEVEPWAEDGHPTGLPTDWPELQASRELVELLATVNPSRDLLATAEGVGWL